MLRGIQVLDLSDERGFLAGKILGDMGADVVKVEPPGGDPARQRGPFLGGIRDPERSLGWLAMNTSKRGVVLDLDASADQERFRGLARGADVVLETARPGAMADRGLGYEALRNENPRIVYCALTPFGQTGPWSQYRAHDLVLVALGGNAALTGHPDRPPVRCSTPTAYFHGGPEAALGIVMALLARQTTGRGQLVDVSLHEAQLQTLLSAPGQFALHGRTMTRSGEKTGGMREIWRALDGYVSFGPRGGAARLPNLVATARYMAECNMAPAWLRDFDWKTYNHNTLGPEALVRLEDAFGAFFASKTMRELYEQALQRRILLAPCNDAREIVCHAQLRARSLFRTLHYEHLDASIEHPDFFAVAKGIQLRGRAPRLGEHQQELLEDTAPAPSEAVRMPAGHPARGLFEGLKILELGSGAAGPVATRYFLEQGATVVRVESAKRPDFLRALWLTPDSRYGLDGSPMFVLLNPDKQSVSLNLQHPEGIALVRRLVAWADVVSENFAPGPMAKWGLDYESLRVLKPELVMVSACLYGQTGPQRSYPGFGGQGSAISGFNHTTGWPDREAHGPTHTITDSLSPRYVGLAIAGALLERSRTGRGQYVDLSQIEAAVYSQSELVVRFSANGEVMGRHGNRDEHAAPHAIYPCAGEDRWIAIAVHDDAEWRALCAAMGSPAWTRDARFAHADARRAAQDELDARMSEWTRAENAHALMARLQQAGVEAGAVQTTADLQSDPQLAHRGHWQEVSHVHLGTLRCERSAIRFSESRGGLSRPGPCLGEHNDAVLGGILSLSAAEIERLVAEEVVA